MSEWKTLQAMPMCVKMDKILSCLVHMLLKTFFFTNIVETAVS